MLCEMCGKSVPATKTVIVEGSRLNVCPNCARFGEDYRASNGGSAPVSQSVIEARLQKREKRMQSKDIYSGVTVELVDDYGGLIKEAREAKGMDRKQFAASISERELTISKIESNSLVPDDKIIKKIEKALGIKLTETVQSGATVGSGGNPNKMTLANFIKKE